MNSSVESPSFRKILPDKLEFIQTTVQAKIQAPTSYTVPWPWDSVNGLLFLVTEEILLLKGVCTLKGAS